MYLDVALAQRLEESDRLSTLQHAEARARLAPESGATWQAVGDGTAVFTGPGLPVSGIFGLGMRAPVTADHLREAAAFFSARTMGATLNLCPFADPSLVAALEGRIRRVVGFKHVWVRPAEAPFAPEPQPNAASHTISVREAQTDDERWLWARLVSLAFGFQGRLEDANTDVSGANAFSVGSRVFTAWQNNQPIGAGALWMGGGVARLYSAATVSGWRNQGAQQALIAARISAARAAGCDLITVATLPGTPSQRNIERFGFRIAYTRVAVELQPAGATGGDRT